MLSLLFHIIWALIKFIAKAIVYTIIAVFALIAIIIALGPKWHEMCKTETRVHDYSKDVN